MISSGATKSPSAKPIRPPLAFNTLFGENGDSYTPVFTDSSYAFCISSIFFIAVSRSPGVLAISAISFASAISDFACPDIDSKAF